MDFKMVGLGWSFDCDWEGLDDWAGVEHGLEARGTATVFAKCVSTSPTVFFSAHCPRNVGGACTDEDHEEEQSLLVRRASPTAEFPGTWFGPCALPIHVGVAVAGPAGFGQGARSLRMLFMPPMTRKTMEIARMSQMRREGDGPRIAARGKGAVDGGCFVITLGGLIPSRRDRGSYLKPQAPPDADGNEGPVEMFWGEPGEMQDIGPCFSPRSPRADGRARRGCDNPPMVEVTGRNWPREVTYGPMGEEDGGRARGVHDGRLGGL